MVSVCISVKMIFMKYHRLLCGKFVFCNFALEFQ